MAGVGGRARRAGDPARRRRRGDRRPRNRPSRTVFDARGADPDDDRLRAARTRRRDGAAAAVGPGVMVPGLLRTRLGQRPGVADDPRRAAGRSVDRQRPEGVDQLRAVRHPVRPAHPHRRRRTPPITRPSPRSSSTWTPPASRCGRCAPCTTSTSSARSTSTTSWCPRTGCSATPATAGGWRWICCPTNARPASGSASPTCTRGSTR